ncbi:MAG TPA: beta-3-deoxy-D-manno-oct-2-ulosonic acid transferase [Stellaceae bacterium]|jgi:capsular polysaccharide export protein|nr:beta-3-deoxy-D-manno-oct-2-ulosonic acid transferase [Stellaceae bacterium]
MSASVNGEGVLRAMPRGRAPAVRISEMDDPGPILAERGWETPELMARAAAARQALVAAGVGGAWWRDDPDDEFVALLAGEQVRCEISTFYSGWGVTDDGPAVPRQPFARTVDEIFAGACLIASRYTDPFRGGPASFEDTLALVAEWRRLERANREIAVCVGMSFWKRRRIAEFLRSGEGVPVFRRTAAAAIAAAKGRAVACWTSRMPPGLEHANLIRVEDGFVRSVGLGSDFLPPASLVLDRRGMYFDPRTKSDLETLLCETSFDPPLRARARSLAEQLVHRGVTKYNLAAVSAPAIDWPAGRRRVLVPGQVEDDLSVVLGGGDIRDNLALLARARAAAPDAFIVYKPHPDVLAGHRKGMVAEADALRFADRIVTNAATASLLGEIDELHTLTSLAGFEALLRGRRVVVYGRPWYAGWGLTDDSVVIERGRQLTLEELVAGALIVYPRYLDPVTRLPCGPETIIERLDHPELWRAGLLVRARRLQGAAARRIAERFARSPALAEGVRKGRG